MQVTAKLNYLRIAPRKVRLIADMIRRKKVEEAQAILRFTVKRASQPVLKLLNSAVANGKNNFQLEENNLYISKITVDEGPKLKRWRARARGRAMEIQKKTSHITLVLDEIKPTIRKKKVEKPAEKKPLEKNIKEESIIKEIGVEKIEKEKAKEVTRREKKSAEITQKPKERGGIKRFFRRKSF